MSFNEFFKEAFEKLGLETRAISTAFKVGRPTIERWLDNSSTPNELLQKQIIRWLERRLKRKERIDKNAEAISEDNSRSD